MPKTKSRKRRSPAKKRVVVRAKGRRKRKSSGGGLWWRVPLKIGIIGFAFGSLALLAVVVAYGAIAKRFDLDKLATMPERSVVFDRSGREIGRIHGANRIAVKLEDISPYFVSALLVREDARFYEHNGVDFIGVLRSTVRNVKSKRVVQGASTLTMQLARNTYDMMEDKSLHRKMIEIMLARRIESRFSKEEILQHYANRIFFGSGIHGIERASQLYFGKRAKSMTLDEAAMIVGIIRAPNRFSPFRQYEDAVRERNVVLDRMLEK